LSIPNTNQESVIRSGGTLRTQGMTIDTASLPHLMNVLTNLYSNPVAAVIREYSTNAMDSHVAAGKPNLPIKVGVPTALNPVFSVQDFGLGLSHDEIFDIYGAYGASTKRTSADTTGQLGLGCKSALTYVDQFTLTTVKDGNKGVYSIYKNDAGVPTLTQLSASITDEPNGVLVSIPLPGNGYTNLSQFHTEMKNIFQYWDVMPEFNGTFSVVSAVDAAEKLSDSIYLVDNGGAVVMGNVAYPFRNSALDLDWDEKNRANSLLVFAPLGAVDFTPSREELHATKRTKEFVKQAIAQAEALLQSKVEKEVEEAETLLEAYQIAQKAWQGGALYFNLDPHYKGRSLKYRPDELNFQCTKYTPDSKERAKSYTAFPYYSHYRGSGDIVFYKGAPSGYFARKIKKYAQDNGCTVYAITGAKPSSEVIPERMYVSHEEINSIKLDSRAPGEKKEPRLRVFTRDWKQVLVNKKNADLTKVVYGNRNDWDKYLPVVKELASVTTIIPTNMHVSKKDTEHVYKGLKGARHVSKFVDDTLSAVSISKEALMMFARKNYVSSYMFTNYSAFRSTKGGSEALGKLRGFPSYGDTTQKTIATLLRLKGSGISHTVLTEVRDRLQAAEKEIKEALEEARKEYPLLFSAGLEELQNYINERGEG